MARTLLLDDSVDQIRQLSRRLFQSGNINFLIGSGASAPAIPVVGTLEQEIIELFEANKTAEANAKMYEFLTLVQEPTNHVISDSPDTSVGDVLKHYQDFIRILEHILSERKTDLLPRQANVFTTNYDLFVEKASECSISLKLNDGFSRVPSLDRRTRFSAQGFFDSVYSRGPMHSYKVELPCVNLLKLHGSLSWKKHGEEVLFEVAQKQLLEPDEIADPAKVASFVESYAVVLPERVKFQETLMNQIHYDLMRIFANQLDKAHSLLVAFGFSFDDGHIYHVIQRALSNPTLILLIYAFDEASAGKFEGKFSSNSNVYILKPQAGEETTFEQFNSALRSVLPVENAL